MHVTKCKLLALGVLLSATGCSNTGLPIHSPGSSHHGQTSDAGVFAGTGGTAGAPSLPESAGSPSVRPPPTTSPPPMAGAGAAGSRSTMPTRDGGVAGDGGVARDGGFGSDDASVRDAGMATDAGVVTMPQPFCPDGEHHGDVDILSQEQLQMLSGCKRVFGSLSIRSSSIAELSALSALESVSGDLQIGPVGEAPGFPANTVLTSLKGLEALRSVRTLNLIQLAALSSLEALTGLETADSLLMYDVGSLVNLNGLGHVEWHVLHIQLAAKLTSLDGLHVPAQVGSVELMEAPLLASLQALRPLEHLDSLMLDTLPALKSLDGLQSLKPGYTSLSLMNCSALSDLTGLGGYPSSIVIEGNAMLRSLAGVVAAAVTTQDVTILNDPLLESLMGIVPTNQQLMSLALHGLPSLKSLADLKTLTQVQNLEIVQCDGLKDLTGLEALKQVPVLVISDCAGLQNLSGLSGLQGGSSAFSLQNNPALTSLVGLEKLTEALAIELYGNLALQNLTGLTALQQVESLRVSGNASFKNFQGSALRSLAELNVEGNPVLADLSGLENLTTVSGGMQMVGNASLISMRALANVMCPQGANIQQNQRLPQCEIEWFATHTATPVQSSDNGPPGTCAP